MVGIAASLVLVLDGRQGHPPAIVFLPVVLVAWAVGHGLIWAVRRLARAGLRQVADPSQGPTWPFALKVTAVGTAVAALVGVGQVIGSVASGQWYPFRQPAMWAALLLVWIAHGTCLVGLLLRRRWSRAGSALLCAGWAVLLAAQAVDGIRRGTADTTGGIIAAALVALLLLLAAHLVRSSKVRAFLGG